jgi:hypothetical protein
MDDLMSVSNRSASIVEAKMIGCRDCAVRYDLPTLKAIKLPCREENSLVGDMGISVSKSLLHIPKIRDIQIAKVRG